MKKTIHISSLGNVIQSDRFPDWWESEKSIEVPFFDRANIKFTITAEENDIDDAFNTAIDNFLQLKSTQRGEMSKYVYKNYKECRAAFGQDESNLEVNNENDIWKLVHPKYIFVSRRSKDHLVYIEIAAECDWEEEHGLQIIYKNGNTLSRVSAQDGHLTYADAYGLSESEDRIC